MTQLDNGIRIISNSMQNLETVSVGAWVSAGTRHEEANENGISHLLEHMAFKGTKRRSALQIAEEIEAVGGNINAYTSRENTAYYAKVLKEDSSISRFFKLDNLYEVVCPDLSKPDYCFA